MVIIRTTVAICCCTNGPFVDCFQWENKNTWSKFPDKHTYFGQNVHLVGFHNGTHFKPNVEIKCCRLFCTRPIDKTMYYKSRRHTHSYRTQILKKKYIFITFSLDAQQDSIDNGIKTFSTQRKSHQKNKNKTQLKSLGFEDTSASCKK